MKCVKIIYGFSQSCRLVARPCHDVYNFTSFYVGRSLRTKLHFRLTLHMTYTFKRDIKHYTIYVEVNNMVRLQRIDEVCTAMNVCKWIMFFFIFSMGENTKSIWMIENKDMNFIKFSIDFNDIFYAHDRNAQFNHIDDNVQSWFALWGFLKFMNNWSHFPRDCRFHNSLNAIEYVYNGIRFN